VLPTFLKYKVEELSFIPGIALTVVVLGGIAIGVIWGMDAFYKNFPGAKPYVGILILCTIAGVALYLGAKSLVVWIRENWQRAEMDVRWRLHRKEMVGGASGK